MSGETRKVPHTFMFVSLFRYVLKFEITDVVGLFGGENPGLGRRRTVCSPSPAAHQHCGVEASKAVSSGRVPAPPDPTGCSEGVTPQSLSLLEATKLDFHSPQSNSPGLRAFKLLLGKRTDPALGSIT